MEEDRWVGAGKGEGRNDQPGDSECEPDLSFIFSFLTQFIQYLKETLGSMRTLTHHSIDKFEERELGKSFYRAISGDMTKIDSVLDGLLNYMSLYRPIKTANTLHVILEEILGEFRRQLEEKKIKILTKCEKDLPETSIPDGTLRYIIHSVFQYAVLSTAPGGTLGLLTRSAHVRERTEGSKGRRYVEILVVLNETTEPLPGAEKENAVKLILLLVKEVVQRNGGTMRLGSDQKLLKKFISLRFPALRR